MVVRVQVRWTLRGNGYHWFEATVTKERSGSIYVKHRADGAEDWVSFPDPACRMELQSSALGDIVSFQNGCIYCAIWERKGLGESAVGALQ